MAKQERVSYGPPRGDAEREALGRLLALSFGFPVADTGVWFARAGLSNLRVIRAGERVQGGLIQLPMGQYFGGRRVEMVGYAGVGVAPEARARGVATELMKRGLRELALRGVAISTLFPASLPLYRRAGFEVAGGWYRMCARIRDFPRQGGPSALQVRSYEPADERAVRLLYARHARERNGWLDRSEYIWERTRREQDGAAVFGHVLERAGRMEGYVFYRQRRGDHGFHLDITDAAAETTDALLGIAAFIADHRSIGDQVCWHGGPDDPLLASLREHVYQLELRHHWMVRIVDVKAALEARGYPRRLEASLGLHVADEVVGANQGRFVLDVAGGRGKVKRGGRGELKLHIRALAPLYSGFMSAQMLALLGRVEGSDQTLRRASAIFGGPAPSLPDMF